MVRHAYATLGDVLAVVESDDGRKCARQEVETPYRDLEIKYEMSCYCRFLVIIGDLANRKDPADFDLFGQAAR